MKYVNVVYYYVILSWLGPPSIVREWRVSSEAQTRTNEAKLPCSNKL